MMPTKKDEWHELIPKEVDKRNKRVRYSLVGLRRFNDVCIPVGKIERVDIFMNDFLFDTITSEELQKCEILTHNDRRYYSWRSLACDSRLRLIVGQLLYRVKRLNPSFISYGIVSFLSELDLQEYGIEVFSVVITYEGRPQQTSLYMR